MAAIERITMTMRQLDRYMVIQAVANGILKPWRAAERARADDAADSAVGEHLIN